MKVIMLGRIGLLKNGGGDKIQVENTAKELRNLGVTVDVSSDLTADLSNYDIVHIFQLDWGSEAYLHAKRAKKLGKPVVLSPIHHSVAEVKRYDDIYTFGFRKLAKYLFNDQFKRDMLKNVYRTISDPSRIFPTSLGLVYGLKNLHKKTLELVDTVFVQTEKEALDLKETYDTTFNFVKVPNGVGEVFITKKEFTNTLPISDYIICVGRIEPRKNQINIIKAIEQMRAELKKDIGLVFIGLESIHKHKTYIKLFRKELDRKPWIIHIPSVPYEEIPGYYHFAKVCVSASWFETTGLTSLEAIFCKTNAVAAGDQAKEYLGALAAYCDPGDITSIKNATIQQYMAPRPEVPSDMIKEYTWKNAAEKSLAEYKKLLDFKGKTT